MDSSTSSDTCSGCPSWLVAAAADEKVKDAPMPAAAIKTLLLLAIFDNDALISVIIISQSLVYCRYFYTKAMPSGSMR